MKAICLAALGLSWALNVPAQANLLSNPGFETGDLSGWTVGGKNGGFGVSTAGTLLPVTSAVSGMPDFYFTSYQNVRSGTYGAYAIVAGDTQSAFREYASFSQTLTLSQGTYQFGFWMSTVDDNGGVGLYNGLTSRLLGIYVDGSYVPFTIAPSSSSSISSAWVEFASQESLGAGAHVFDFHISAGGTKRVGMSLDDVFVTEVPEPSGLSVLGMFAVIGLCRFSRITPSVRSQRLPR